MRLNFVHPTIGSTVVNIDKHEIKVDVLRVLVAQQLVLALPSSDLHRLRLIKNGNVLNRDEDIAGLEDEDTLLVAVAPRPAPTRDRLVNLGLIASQDGDIASNEFDVFFRIPPLAPAWQRRTAMLLIQRLSIPESVIAPLLWVSWKVWASILGWGLLVKLASYAELGPIVIVGTIFAGIVLIGFSQRKDGSLSAYSLFNPQLQRLPGQLTAEQLDGQLRRGHM